jgi:ABC-2 type transport system permease protein
MAVYRRRYQAGAAPAGLRRRRFLVFTRYDLRALASTRLFVMFFALSFAAPLVGAVLIYLHFNPMGLKVLEAGLDDLLPINGDFFLRFLIVQTTLGSLLAALVGPGLVAPDLANNALPLYLARPIRKRDYIAGKLLVLVGMMSVLTWVPIMLLFGLQSALQGWSWLAGNLRIAAGIMSCSLLWILVVSLLTLAISAWVRWRPIATLSVFGYFFVSSAMGAMVNEALDTEWGSVLIAAKLMRFLWSDFFGIPSVSGALPAVASVAALAVTSAVFLAMLVRRVRAFEVVRS